MIDVIISFVFGLIVGGIVGTFVFALCAIQKRGDGMSKEDIAFGLIGVIGVLLLVIAVRG